jgi:16S rRNA processing protein RimM
MAPARPPAKPDDGRPPVVLGRVGAPHGLLGWVKVQSYTEPLEGIVNYGPWELARGPSLGSRAVLDWKRAGSGIAVRLEGVGSREEAQALTGAEILVARSELPEPGPGEVYWHDLIGLAAFSPSGVPLGRVAGVLELPAHPVLVLQGERERLVPLVPERLAGIDLEAGRLTLDWHPDD